jgi:hypothetical protein
MRRAAFVSLSALALAHTGCAFRPWTPSVEVAFWAQEVPKYKEVNLPSTRLLASQWQLPSDNPWARYQKPTLIAAVDSMPDRTKLPDVRELDVVHDAITAGNRVADAGIPSDLMFVVDMRGAASCAFGASLSRTARTPVSNVVTFNNWPANDSLIPAEEALAGMIAFSPKPAVANTQAAPVFLLDSWRLAYPFDIPDEDTYDNRYALGPADLPEPETLQTAGISRVVYVVEDLDDTDIEEDDLHAAFAAYRDAGIELYVMDLASLTTELMADRWNAVIAPYRYALVNRITILDNPHFYARAHGGFGGTHGRPSTFSGSHGHGYSG